VLRAPDPVVRGGGSTLTKPGRAIRTLAVGESVRNSRRTQPAYCYVPALSGLLPPSPAHINKAALSYTNLLRQATPRSPHSNQKRLTAAVI